MKKNIIFPFFFLVALVTNISSQDLDIALNREINTNLFLYDNTQNIWVLKDPLTAKFINLHWDSVVVGLVDNKTVMVGYSINELGKNNSYFDVLFAFTGYCENNGYEKYESRYGICYKKKDANEFILAATNQYNESDRIKYFDIVLATDFRYLPQ
jgi:hypothetical protein